MITKVEHAAAINALGRAFVYFGDPFDEYGGMQPLGATLGDISVVESREDNKLMTPEYTGTQTAMRRKVQGVGITATTPIIPPEDPDEAAILYAALSALGAANGGHSSPQDVIHTCLLIVPEIEIGSGLSRAAGGPWIGPNGSNGPVHAIWIWNAVPQPFTRNFGQSDGGQRVWSITWEGDWDETKPEGAKIFHIGDPVLLTPTVDVIL